MKGCPVKAGNVKTGTVRIRNTVRVRLGSEVGAGVMFRVMVRVRIKSCN